MSFQVRGQSERLWVVAGFNAFINRGNRSDEMKWSWDAFDQQRKVNKPAVMWIWCSCLCWPRTNRIWSVCNHCCCSCWPNNKMRWPPFWNIKDKKKKKARPLYLTVNHSNWKWHKKNTPTNDCTSSKIMWPCFCSLPVLQSNGQSKYLFREGS